MSEPTENLTVDLAETNASATPSAFRYPVALDVTGCVCVVVGGGAVGERKAGALLDAGARVIVVAPLATEGVQKSAAEGALEWRVGPFSAFVLENLEDVFLLIAATDEPVVNAAVRDAARALRILFNAAAPLSNDSEGDDNGDFATMATVRRGDLLVAVTTGGAGPALAARLKRELSAQFGPEWAPYVRLLASARRDAKARIADPDARANALRRIASDENIFTLIAAGDGDGAQREVDKCLSL